MDDLLPYPDAAVQDDPTRAPLTSARAVTPTVAAAVVRARAADSARTGRLWGVGHCLLFARTVVGGPGGQYDAITAWGEASRRHTAGVAPAGFPVFWRGGTEGHGHVAVSDGAGWVWSTDVLRPGRVDRVEVGRITAGWRQTLLGWSEDLAGVRITAAAGVPWPLPAGQVFAQDPRSVRGRVDGTESAAAAAWVRAVQRKVGAAADGVYGPVTAGAVQAWCRAHRADRRDGVVDAGVWRLLFP